MAWLVRGMAKLLVAALPLLAGCAGHGAERVRQTTRSDRYPEIALRWADLPAASGAEPATHAELVSTEGVSLALLELRARGVVEGPLAFTELHLVFQNPEPRTLEGRFTFRVPPGASLGRFAMRVAGVLQEGEMLPRPKAQAVYDDYLRRGRDPGLLNQNARDLFQARIFPILAHERREIIIAYSHELPERTDPYRVPLRGFPRIQKLDVRAVVSGLDATGARGPIAYELSAQDIEPDRDFVLPLAGRVDLPDAARGAHFAIARVTPELRQISDVPDALTILVDTSASRAAALAGDVAYVEELVRALAASGNPSIRLFAFDQELRAVHAGPARDVTPESFAALLDEGAFGATDIAQALGQLSERNAIAPRLVVLTDCLSTQGSSGQALQDDVEAFGRAGLERLDVIALGEARDHRCALDLASAGARPGALLEENTPGQRPEIVEVARALRNTPAGAVRLEVPGSRWTHPRIGRGLAPGTSLVVFAELPPDRPFVIHAGGTTAIAPRTTWVDEAFAARAAGRVRLEELTARLAGAPGPEAIELQANIVRISRERRVLSPFTSLLVLESDAEYRRWGIAQDAQSDILEAGEWRVERRRPSPVGARSKSPVPVLTSDLLPEGIDSDDDGLFDDRDHCPDVPGGDNGCPKTNVVAQGNEMQIVYAVLFERGSDRLRDQNHAVLEVLVAFLKERPSLRIVVQGHTDGSGAPGVNQAVSERRARAVRDYLVARDIRAERLQVRGFGATRPLAPDTTEEGRWNRRVDFEIVSEKIQEVKPSLPVYHRGTGRTGSALEVQRLIEGGKPQEALSEARAEYGREPGPMNAILVGEAYAALEDTVSSARAYGSLLDFARNDALERALAGYWLEHLLTRTTSGTAPSIEKLMLDAYRGGAGSHAPRRATRDLAMALLHAGRPKEAYSLLLDGSRRAQSFALHRELALAAAAATRADPAHAAVLEAELRAAGVPRLSDASIEIALEWNDRKSGVDLVASTHDGKRFGPYTVIARAPYDAAVRPLVRATFPASEVGRRRRIAVQAVGQLPALGRVQIVHHDGAGVLSFTEKPFLLQAREVLVELGEMQ